MASVVFFNTGTDEVVELKDNVGVNQFTGAGTIQYITDPEILGIRALFGSFPKKYIRHASGIIREKTQQEKNAADAAEAAAILAALRGAASAIVDATDALAKVMRGSLLVTLDEFNVVRQWLASFKVETAASTNLSNFQTRVATLPNMPDRTATQLRTAIKNKINAGDSDQ